MLLYMAELSMFVAVVEKLLLSVLKCYTVKHKNGDQGRQQILIYIASLSDLCRSK